MNPKTLTFGWIANGAADGFEQEHGHYTTEVYWREAKRIWTWIVWGYASPKDEEHSILMQGNTETLEEAKKIGLNRIAMLERQRMKSTRKV